MKIKEYFMERSIANSLRLKVVLLLFLLVAVFGVRQVFAQSVSVYKLQALFLYNFTKQIKWEETSGNSFTVGVFGGSDVFNEIKGNLENKSAWGKTIKVVMINSPEDVKNCQMAYLSKTNPKKVLEILQQANFSNTLLVTEDDLTDQGAAISFVFENSKMNFKISKEKVEEAGLKVSNTLLSIGKAV